MCECVHECVKLFEFEDKFTLFQIHQANYKKKINLIEFN